MKTSESDVQAVLAKLNQGQFKSALKHARAAGKQYKKHPAFANFEGIALSSLSKHREAAAAFQKALRLDPAFNDARKNLAQALVLLQQPETALKLLRKYLEDSPGDAAAWYLLGQVQLNLGDPAGAADSASRSLSLNPKQSRAYNLRGIARNAAGQEAEAVDDFEAALQQNPDDVETLVNISLPLARQTRYDEADQAIRKAVALAPAHRGARLRLGMHLMESGDNAAAQQEFSKLLEFAPGDPDAIEQLAQLNTADQNEGLEPLARKVLKSAPRHSEAAASLNFALARVAAQRGDDSLFARHIAQANASMAYLYPYDPADDERVFTSLMARFPVGGGQPDQPDISAPQPIYVLGLPRSGTTLTEAILGAHPTVCPLGERAVPGVLLSDYLETDTPFGDGDRQAFVANDMIRLPALPEGAASYVDKMPENYRLIGFLATAYPNSPIIHVRRDPRDIGLSLWQAHFSGRALSYAYDLQAMAHRFNLYARLMQHWHQVFPGRILDLRYEDLVADVETVSHELARFCRLDWIKDMARPDRASGQVLTLSATQLRQPVHSRSIGNWRRHEEMLAPFIKALNPDLWPEIAD